MQTLSRKLKVCRPCLIKYGPLLRSLTRNHAIYSLIRKLYIVLYRKPVLLKRQLTPQLFDPLLDSIRFLTHLAPPFLGTNLCQNLMLIIGFSLAREIRNVHRVCSPYLLIKSSSDRPPAMTFWVGSFSANGSSISSVLMI